MTRVCRRDFCEVIRESRAGMELHLANDHELPDEFVTDERLEG